MAHILLNEQPAFICLPPEFVDDVLVHLNLRHFVSRANKRENVDYGTDQAVDLINSVSFCFPDLNIDENTSGPANTKGDKWHLICGDENRPSNIHVWVNLSNRIRALNLYIRMTTQTFASLSIASTRFANTGLVNSP